jgi:hypothetical protein
MALIDFHLLFWQAQQRLPAALDVLTLMFKTSALRGIVGLRFETGKPSVYGAFHP